MQNYSTNLSDSQWQVITCILNVERKRKYSLRNIVDAILYIVKTGCQWRMLPFDFPRWEVVYYYFSRWKRAGTITQLCTFLVKTTRKKCGKEAEPSVGIMDAQSVKSTLVSSKENTGYDGGKKIKGVKRHIVVDAAGLLLSVVTHSAQLSDRNGSKQVLNRLSVYWNKIEKLYVDGGYHLPGKNQRRDEPINGYPIEIVKRSDVKKWEIMPKRWIVERSFAWFETNRRNAKNYERSLKTASAIVELSAIRIMLKKF